MKVFLCKEIIYNNNFELMDYEWLRIEIVIIIIRVVKIELKCIQNFCIILSEIGYFRFLSVWWFNMSRDNESYSIILLIFLVIYPD